MAAEDRGPMMHAHIGMLKTLGRGTPAPDESPRLAQGSEEIPVSEIGTNPGFARPRAKLSLGELKNADDYGDCGRTFSGDDRRDDRRLEIKDAWDRNRLR
jgi:hypothetical protein